MSGDLLQMVGLCAEIRGAYLLAASYLTHIGAGTDSSRLAVMLGALVPTRGARRAASGVRVNDAVGIDLIRGLSFLLLGFSIQILGLAVGWI